MGMERGFPKMCPNISAPCVGLGIKITSYPVYVVYSLTSMVGHMGTFLSSNMLETVVLIATFIVILPELVEIRSDHLPMNLLQFVIFICLYFLCLCGHPNPVCLIK